MAMQYNDPINGSPSSIGAEQFNDFLYKRKALTQAAKEMYFSQMATVEHMPKHYGKTIKLYEYLPLLSDANINDQGIDASGLSTTVEATIVVTSPEVESVGNGFVSEYFVGEGADGTIALNAAKANFQTWAEANGIWSTDYATTKAALEGEGWTVDDTMTAVPQSGNLYGSSKDVGTISAKLPVLGENGGRVNRVGFKRISLQGRIEKFGFFREYTADSVQFDTDAEFQMHINTEMLNGANEITEDALQIDLLNGAGIVRFGGAATKTSEVTGEGTVSVLTYEMLMRLNTDLTNNRTPKNTKIISGSKMTDTMTVNNARYMYIGSELIPTFRRMKDLHNDKAFISKEKYAAAGDLARGEIGAVDQFRIILVPEMHHWAGAGATVGTNGGYRETGGKYDVFPALVIGSGSFTTIGFQTDGKTVKFKIIHKAPGEKTADRNDPYGEIGFMSIKWWYGTMILRPERIGLCKVVGEW